MHDEESIAQHTGRSMFTRDFILGFFAFFFFLTANQSLTPTLPIYLTKLGSNEREIGVLIGIFAVAALASRLFVGRALLKYREKSIMMVAGRLFGGKIMDTCNKEKLIVTFLPSMVVILIILSLSKTLPMFIIVGAFWGIGAAFFVPMSMAYALEYSGSSDGAAVGTFRAISDLGLGLGPVVTGIIIPFTGYPVMFLCLALICLINMSYFQFYVRKKGNL